MTGSTVIAGETEVSRRVNVYTGTAAPKTRSWALGTTVRTVESVLTKALNGDSKHGSALGSGPVDSGSVGVSNSPTLDSRFSLLESGVGDDSVGEGLVVGDGSVGEGLVVGEALSLEDGDGDATAQGSSVTISPTATAAAKAKVLAKSTTGKTNTVARVIRRVI